MKTLNILSAVILFSLFVACSTPKELSKKNVFAFDYEGEQYEIICINTPEGEGTNFLNLQKDNNRILYARDLNQDGWLDTIVKGDMSIDKANLIYEAGIDQAIQKGKLRIRIAERTYEYTKADVLYAIETSGFYREKLHNSFIIYDEGGLIDILILDVNADGILDEVQQGNATLEEAQSKYDEILQNGIRESRIEKVNGNYIVKEKARNQPS